MIIYPGKYIECCICLKLVPIQQSQECNFDGPSDLICENCFNEMEEEPK
jgi:hypothetical protein